jgi:Ca-activated chloride channel family protein
VANLTGGQYFAAADAGRLQDVLRELPRTVATQQRDVEVSVAPLALAAVLMLGALWAAGRWSVGS